MAIPYVGVVGSREFSDLNFLTHILNAAYLRWGPFILVSGGARGADKMAERWADANGLQKIIYLADWQTYGKIAGFKRNKSIVNRSDKLIAFTPPQNPTKGTAHTIRLAMDKGGIPIYIVWPGAEPMTINTGA